MTMAYVESISHMSTFGKVIIYILAFLQSSVAIVAGVLMCIFVFKLMVRIINSIHMAPPEHWKNNGGNNKEEK